MEINNIFDLQIYSEDNEDSKNSKNNKNNDDNDDNVSKTSIDYMVEMFANEDKLKANCDRHIYKNYLGDTLYERCNSEDDNCSNESNKSNKINNIDPNYMFELFAHSDKLNFEHVTFTNKKYDNENDNDYDNSNENDNEEDLFYDEHTDYYKEFHTLSQLNYMNKFTDKNGIKENLSVNEISEITKKIALKKWRAKIPKSIMQKIMHDMVDDMFNKN